MARQNVQMLIRVKQERMKLRNCEDSLKAFFREAWLHMEPGVDYVHGWHIDAIAEHLEAVLTGEIRKLIINVPPRSSKSSLIAVAWPAWVWIKNPYKRWLFSSFDLRLSKRDSRKCRQLIKSNWYQRHWG